MSGREADAACEMSSPLPAPPSSTGAQLEPTSQHHSMAPQVQATPCSHYATKLQRSLTPELELPCTGTVKVEPVVEQHSGMASGSEMQQDSQIREVRNSASLLSGIQEHSPGQDLVPTSSAIQQGAVQLNLVPPYPKNKQTLLQRNVMPTTPEMQVFLLQNMVPPNPVNQQISLQQNYSYFYNNYLQRALLHQNILSSKPQNRGTLQQNVVPPYTENQQFFQQRYMAPPNPGIPYGVVQQFTVPFNPEIQQGVLQQDFWSPNPTFQQNILQQFHGIPPNPQVLQQFPQKNNNIFCSPQFLQRAFHPYYPPTTNPGILPGWVPSTPEIPFLDRTPHPDTTVTSPNPAPRTPEPSLAAPQSDPISSTDPVEHNMPGLVQSDKKYQCQQCAYATNDQSNYSRHQRTHSRVRPLRFELRDETEAGRLNTHMNNIQTDETEKLSCPHCHYVTPWRTTLARHIRTHTKERPFVCSVCGYAAAQNSCLKAHIMAIHTGDRNLSCPHCQYVATQKFALTRHIRKHTSECSVCGYATVQNSRLQILMATHTGDTKFSCPHCGYTTITSSTNLKSHKSSRTTHRVWWPPTYAHSVGLPS